MDQDEKLKKTKQPAASYNMVGGGGGKGQRAGQGFDDVEPRAEREETEAS